MVQKDAIRSSIRQSTLWCVYHGRLARLFTLRSLFLLFALLLVPHGPFRQMIVLWEHL